MSLRIRDLEARLGARLFHRTRPRVSLTREGVRLAAQVRAPFDDLRGVFEKRGTRDRAVKVTAAPTFGKRWLPPRIPRFLALYPDVTIEIEASVDLRSIEGARVRRRRPQRLRPMARAHRARARAGVPRADAVAVARKVARRNRKRRGPVACAAAVGGGVAGLVQGGRHRRLVECPAPAHVVRDAGRARRRCTDRGSVSRYSPRSSSGRRSRPSGSSARSGRHFRGPRISTSCMTRRDATPRATSSSDGCARRSPLKWRCRHRMEFQLRRRKRGVGCAGARLMLTPARRFRGNVFSTFVPSGCRSPDPDRALRRSSGETAVAGVICLPAESCCRDEP